MAVSIEKATMYERYRLPYASQAVADLLDYIGPVQVIADIGTGTGQLARLFADRCTRLYAVEPEPAMRQVASTALAEWTTVEVRAGCGEHTTLDDRSVDLIVIGNAFHRFKPEACTELRRILKPSGWIAIFWYSLTNKPLADMRAEKLATLKHAVSRMAELWLETPARELFGEADIHTWTYRQSRTDDWTTFFGSSCTWLEAPEPGDPEFGPFEAINREVFEAFAENGAVQVDYETYLAFGQPEPQNGTK
jgi:SAM-dependent methyltransferase